MIFRIFEKWHLHKNGKDLGLWYVQQVFPTSVKFYQPDSKEHIRMNFNDKTYNCKLVEPTPFKW